MLHQWYILDWRQENRQNIEHQSIFYQHQLLHSYVFQIPEDPFLPCGFITAYTQFETEQDIFFLNYATYVISSFASDVKFFIYTYSDIVNLFQFFPWKSFWVGTNHERFCFTSEQRKVRKYHNTNWFNTNDTNCKFLISHSLVYFII